MLAQLKEIGLVSASLRPVFTLREIVSTRVPLDPGASVVGLGAAALAPLCGIAGHLGNTGHPGKNNASALFACRHHT